MWHNTLGSNWPHSPNTATWLVEDFTFNLVFQKAYICILTISLKCFWTQKYRDYELSK